MPCKCVKVIKEVEKGKTERRIINTAVNAIKQRCQAPTAAVAKQLLIRASDLLDTVLEHALEIAEKELSVTYYYLEDGNNCSQSIGIYQVSFNDELLYIPPECNYCPCDVYTNDVISGHVSTCQHVLACELADILGKTHRVASKAKEIAEMTQAMVGITSDFS